MLMFCTSLKYSGAHYSHLAVERTHLHKDNILSWFGRHFYNSVYFYHVVGWTHFFWLNKGIKGAKIIAFKIKQKTGLII